MESRILSTAFVVLLAPTVLGASSAEQDSADHGAYFVARHEASLQSLPDSPGFRAPEGVSTDPLGQVFVADTGNHRVCLFSPAGRFVRELGGYGWDDGEFVDPTDVCARGGFRLFVVDFGNDRIQEFSISDESPVGVVFPFRAGAGFSDEELVRPVRMDTDAEGRLYFSDALSHCVWVFAPTGEPVGKLGGLGEEPGRFRDPAGVAVGPDGRVFVVDRGNRRIQVFDALGNWRASWQGGEGFVDPTGIDVGARGNVFVADAGAARVRIFTPAGVPLFSFGERGDAPGRFLAPVDVAVAEDGRVFVVDREREAVEVFRILTETRAR
ncbi:MAG: NHL repeat-containing protein [Gemmatimonadota bacterium]|nr:NHL repeat-containing protein [Gemmatimonadota bacterium]